jgi:serine protein kinase
MDNIEAFLDGHTVEDEWGEAHEPDEGLMRSIEEKIQITDSGKKSFRQEIYRKMLKGMRDTGEYNYKDHPRLRDALERQLFDERKDTIRLTVSSRNPDEKELRKVNQVVDVLCEKYDYTAQSANQLLRYVNSLMARN